jgi:hypothetical protein
VKETRKPIYNDTEQTMLSTFPIYDDQRERHTKRNLKDRRNSDRKRGERETRGEEREEGKKSKRGI